MFTYQKAFIKEQNFTSGKDKKKKGVGRVGQVIKHLPSKHKALSSTPSITKRKREIDRERERQNLAT
jgi:hypothetical protein